MRYLFCLLIAVVSLDVIKAVTESDAIEMLGSFADNCEDKPNEEDFKNIVRNVENVPDTTKCFRLCLMDQLNMLDSNGKLDPEKLRDICSMVFEDKDEEVLGIAKDCNDKVNNENKCEAAHEYAMCILNEMKSKEWPIPELDKE